MFIQKDIKNKIVTYRFRYRDSDGKLMSVPTSVYAHVDNTNLQKMEEHLPIIASKYDHQAKERENRESWHDKYYSFQALLDTYVEATKESAPRSWTSKVPYFQFYVLPYFLNEKHANNLEEWKTHFTSFRKYLKNVKQVRSRTKKLSLNSQNHCITELNNFLSVMAKDSPPRCDIQTKCPQIEDKEEASSKSIDQVMTETEVKALYKFLLKENKTAAYLLILLVNTGCRIQEALGLGPACVIKNKIPHEQLNKLLKALDFDDYEFHIFFNKQLDNTGIVKDNIKWAPLKGRKTIHEKNTRYVPIFDKLAAEVLTILMVKAKKDFQEKKYGKAISEYLFFGRELSQAVIYNLMKKFYAENTQYHTKTPHDCRHTMSTMLAGKDISGTLGKVILGHSEKIQKHYNHIFEQMSRVNTRKNVDVFKDF